MREEQRKDRQPNEMEEEAVQTTAAAARTSTSRSDTPAWWIHREVLARLRVDHRTIQRAMRETPPHIHKPWVNFGTPRRPKYRWEAAGIDQWWFEVNEWRTSKNEDSDIGSDGETLTGENGAVLPRTSKPHGRFGKRSKGPSHGDSRGSLVTLASRLTSRQHSPRT